MKQLATAEITNTSTLSTAGMYHSGTLSKPGATKFSNLVTFTGGTTGICTTNSVSNNILQVQVCFRRYTP